jgi:hypothetical protein
METKPQDTSWENLGVHVVAELKRLNSNVEAMTVAYNVDSRTVWMEIAALKVKAGLWGILGGALAVIPTLFFFWLNKH